MPDRAGPGLSLPAYEPDDVIFVDELDYAFGGGWKPAVSELAHWLRKARCIDYAICLEQEIGTLTTESTPQVEANVLDEILPALALIRNEPPKCLEPEQYQALTSLVSKAINSVQQGRSSLSKSLANIASTRLGIDAYIKAIPPQAAQGKTPKVRNVNSTQVPDWTAQDGALANTEAGSSITARPLNSTEKKILAHCRRKAHKGERIANQLGLSWDHMRRVLARLVREKRLRVTEDGYRTRRRAT